MSIAEIINILFNYASYFLLALYVLVLTVNIITEVIKRLIPVPTDIVVFVVSIAVTVLTLYILATVMNITVMWYYAVGAVILGVFVAYAAMFGFDKFVTAWEKLKEYRKE